MPTDRCRERGRGNLNVNDFDTKNTSNVTYIIRPNFSISSLSASLPLLPFLPHIVVILLLSL